jgi:hypothetical protein
MNLPKISVRANTAPVKFVSTILLFALVLLQALSSPAGTARKPCVERPHFEMPAFEARIPESQQRQNVQIEKPIFEKAVTKVEKATRPVFSKSVLEKPVFQADCIESASLKKVDPAAESRGWNPFPNSGTREEWKPIKSEGRRTRFVSPTHQLQRRAPSGYR